MRIRELREERTLSQEDVAKAIGTHQRNIGRWEKNENEPTSGFLLKLADFFECSTDYLLGRSDDFGVIQTAKPQDELTKEERQLVSDYRELAPALQKMLRATIETWKGSDANAGAKKNTVAFYPVKSN